MIKNRYIDYIHINTGRKYLQLLIVIFSGIIDFYFYYLWIFISSLKLLWILWNVYNTHVFPPHLKEKRLIFFFKVGLKLRGGSILTGSKAPSVPFPCWNQRVSSFILQPLASCCSWITFPVLSFPLNNELLWEQGLYFIYLCVLKFSGFHIIVDVH